MSPKIVTLKVGKGKTTQIGEKEWRKTTYGLEADVSDMSPDELEKLRLDLSFKLDDWLQQEQGGIPPEAVGAIPQIDLAELDECPWQTYQKNPAKKGQVAWIKNPNHFTHFDAPPVLWELVKALECNKNQPLVLGDMQYSVGGKEGQFINRKPAKEKGAR